jgi:hypothetical protein
VAAPNPAFAGVSRVETRFPAASYWLFVVVRLVGLATCRVALLLLYILAPAIRSFDERRRIEVVVARHRDLRDPGMRLEVVVEAGDQGGLARRCRGADRVGFVAAELAGVLRRGAPLRRGLVVDPDRRLLDQRRYSWL